MAEGKTPFPVRLVTPEGVLFDGDAQLLIVTGTGGNIGFYARHAPLVADLRVGSCRIQLEDDSWLAWATSEGFAMVHDSTGRVLVEEAIAIDDINIAEVDEMIAHHANRIETSGQGEHDIYSSDRNAAAKAIAWGEHLKRLHAEHSGSTVGASH